MRARRRAIGVAALLLLGACEDRQPAPPQAQPADTIAPAPKQPGSVPGGNEPGPQPQRPGE